MIDIFSLYQSSSKFTTRMWIKQQGCGGIYYFDRDKIKDRPQIFKETILFDIMLAFQITNIKNILMTTCMN